MRRCWNFTFTAAAAQSDMLLLHMLLYSCGPVKLDRPTWCTPGCSPGQAACPDWHQSQHPDGQTCQRHTNRRQPYSQPQPHPEQGCEGGARAMSPPRPRTRRAPVDSHTSAARPTAAWSYTRAATPHANTTTTRTQAPHARARAGLARSRTIAVSSRKGTASTAAQYTTTHPTVLRSTAEIACRPPCTARRKSPQTSRAHAEHGICGPGNSELSMSSSGYGSVNSDIPYFACNVRHSRRVVGGQASSRCCTCSHRCSIIRSS